MLATVAKATAAADETEVGRLFEEHHARILRAAFRVLGDAAEAEDVLQSVFLQIVRREHPPEAIENFSSYLYRTAINAALDRLRSPQRRSTVPLSAGHGERHPAIEDGGGAQAVELRNWLRQALGALSPRQAEIFVLRYLEGYDNQEIARMLGTSAAVVGVSLFRARGQLQKEIRKLSGGSR